MPTDDLMYRFSSLVQGFSKWNNCTHVYRYKGFVDSSTLGKACRYAKKTKEFFGHSEKEDFVKYLRTLNQELTDLVKELENE